MAPARERLSPLAARVRDTDLLAPGTRVLAACSGGADSVALVLLLDELRRQELLTLVVAHVHHGLRPRDADDDALRVETLCRQLGLELLLRRCDAGAARDRRRRGMEEASRAVRREALEDARAESGADSIALAHTLDDQAETLLLRLVRGAGTAGLGGMRERSGRFVRPLLGIHRTELRDQLRRASISWRSDATNWSPSSARSLVRPLVDRVREVMNARWPEQLSRTARILREESDWLEAQVDAAAADLLVVTPGRPGRVSLGAGGRLQALPAPIALRLVRRALRAARPGLPPPSEDAVRRTLELGVSGTGAREAHVAGVLIRRSGDALLMGVRAAARAPRSVQPLPIPSDFEWGAVGRLSTRVEDAPPDPLAAVRARPDVALLDADRVAGPPAARPARTGDRLRPAGSAVERRLRGLLKDRKVPAEERSEALVVCLLDAEATILCVPGHAVSHDVRVTAATRRLLVVEWRPRAGAST